DAPDEQPTERSQLDFTHVSATPCPLPVRPRLAPGHASLAAAVPPRRRRGRAVALARRAREPGRPPQPRTGLPRAGPRRARGAAPADTAHHRPPGTGNHQAVDPAAGGEPAAAARPPRRGP